MNSARTISRDNGSTKSCLLPTRVSTLFAVVSVVTSAMVAFSLGYFVILVVQFQTPSSFGALVKSSMQQDPHTGSDETGIDTNSHRNSPSALQLLVDIQGVDELFLSSEVDLAHAMIALVRETPLTPISHRCHSITGMGVTCVAILSESSHISLHTWPAESVITLDLFTCIDKSFIPTLATVGHLFAITSAELEKVPHVKWSLKIRGYREGFVPDDEMSRDPLEYGLGSDVLNTLEYEWKEKIFSSKTTYQQVDIYELIHPDIRSLESYELSLSDDNSYESMNPQLYSPDRVLYVDGVLQSSLYGEAAYHEGLVHAGMFSHSNPKRVAIIGGGEGATLRDVLKHSTVEKVIMIEIDEELARLSKVYLPEWSDCSDIQGSTVDSCFEDSRVDVHYEDAFEWFIGNFVLTEASNQHRDKVDYPDEIKSQAEQFDVIIMDALDPNNVVVHAEKLYNNTSFVKSLFSGLSEDGVFVAQLGGSPDGSDPSGELEDDGMLFGFLGHCDFFGPWSILVAFKTYETRADWYRNSAEMQIQLHKRIHRTKSGDPPLLYFDGSTMLNYQVPSKPFETNYCRHDDDDEHDDDEHDDCEKYVGFWPGLTSIPISSVEIRKSSVSDHSGRGVFALVDIPEKVTIDIDQTTKTFHVLPSSWSIFESLYEWSNKRSDRRGIEDEMSGVKYFIEGYGYANNLWGRTHYTIDSGLMTFCNHGCHGSYNYGDTLSSTTESSAELSVIPDYIHRRDVYSPIKERHLRQILSSQDTTLRAIKAHEEILVDYVKYVVQEDWADNVKQLRDQCDGRDVGEVTEYETEF